MSAPSSAGGFVWYELLTGDAEAAIAFYGKVLGFSARMGDAVNGYYIFSSGDTDIAGLMACPEGKAQPAWLGYISVEDVDATMAAVTGEGGTCVVPPTDIPGVGRFALLTDPQGAHFYVMRGLDGMPPSRAFDAMAAGHCRWNELSTTDPDAALAFYGRHFGWRKEGGMPMGEMGEYSFIAVGKTMLGAVMKLPPGMPAPRFTYYFGVTDIDAAAAAVTAGGGAMLYPPSEIPGGEYAGVARDPQGAVFGLVGPRGTKAG